MSRFAVFLLAVAAASAPSGRAVSAQSPQSGARGTAVVEIARAEEQFRLAKVNRDLAALDAVLHESFYETNQNGNSRDKTQMIELFRDFRIQSLTTDESSIRVSGNTAVVSGRQTERNGGFDDMLFTRVYVRNGNRWQLLSSSQFRHPAAQTAYRHAIAPAVIQAPAETVRLQFEFSRDGEIIARPAVTLTNGLIGRVEVNAIGSFAFVPTLRGSDLDINFDILTGARRLRPSLVIGRQQAGAISWTSETSQQIRMTVTWIR